MNAAHATLKYIRTSPQKLRLAADLIRGADTQAALAQLQFLGRPSTHSLTKAIRQAEANAKLLNLLPPFRIQALSIDKGPLYKRWQPVSRGRAHSIHKPTAHINITVQSQSLAPTTTEKITQTPAAAPKLISKLATKLPIKPLKLTKSAQPKPQRSAPTRVVAPRTTSK